MEVEYELTPDDLYAFQWRAAFKSPIGRRARRKIYAGWLLALLLISALPAIGPDGFVISRANFGFLLVAFPVVILAQWYLERRLVRRAILQLLKQEKPGKGQLGRHRLVLSEDGVVETTAVGESRTSTLPPSPPTSSRSGRSELCRRRKASTSLAASGKRPRGNSGIQSI